MRVRRKSNNGRSKIRLLFLCAWLGTGLLIVGGSLLPVVNVPEVAFQLSDKLQHFIAYLLLGLLALGAGYRPKTQITLIALSFFLGILIEFAQPLTGRYFEFNDIVADGVGLCASLFLFYMLRRFFTGSEEMSA